MLSFRSILLAKLEISFEKFEHPHAELNHRRFLRKDGV
jgi:hypothetical protein